jgi:hypothetical protein
MAVSQVRTHTAATQTSTEGCEVNLSKLSQLDHDGLLKAQGAVRTLVDLELLDAQMLRKVRVACVKFERQLERESESAPEHLEPSTPLTLLEDGELPGLDRERIGVGCQYQLDSHLRNAVIEMFGARPAFDVTVESVEHYPNTRKIRAVTLRSNVPRHWKSKSLLRRFRVRNWAALWELRKQVELAHAEKLERQREAAAKKREAEGKPARRTSSTSVTPRRPTASTDARLDEIMESLFA